MKYMLDTNICIYALKGGDKNLNERLRACEAGDLVMSMITRAELEVGFERTKDPQAARQDADEFLTDIPTLSFDAAAAAAYGRLQATAPTVKRLIDRLIAAHALSRDLAIVTNNEADFRILPGLRIENWTAAGGGDY